VVLFGYVFWTGRAWKPATSGDVIAILAGGLGIFFVGTVFWATGQQLTTATLSGLMSSLIPLATAGFSWIILPKDRLSPLGIVGLGVGFFGALLILLPSGALEFSSGLLGKGLIFVGVLIASLASVSIRWAKPSLPATTQTAWATLLGASMTHLLSPVMGESFADVHLTPESIAAILFLGVVSAALGRVLFYWLLAQRTAIEISLTSYVAPVITAAIGWAAFEDPISVSMVVGFLVVVLGFSLMERDAIRREFGRVRARRSAADE
jgi:drug/metabolite transporter (DMT)-like permease